MRMPRSQSITDSLPSLRMYSAAISSSSSVAERPRLSSAGAAGPARPRRAGCSSACCGRRSGSRRRPRRRRATSRTSISSVTIGRPVSSLASWSIARPSLPRPWKLYGEVRGLYAPPRSIEAPASATQRATSSVWSRLSTVHGPGDQGEVAAADLAPVDLEHAFARPCGTATRRACTASGSGPGGRRRARPRARGSRRGRGRRSRRSRSAARPRETWAEQPTDSTRSTTASICSAVAPSFITIIICFVLSKSLLEILRLVAVTGDVIGVRPMVCGVRRVNLRLAAQAAAGRTPR